MPISINHSTKIINVPQSYLTSLGGGVYELDVNQFRLDLKDLEDEADGIVLLDTHRHNTQVTVGGVTLARVVEIINGYTVTFQDTGSPYSVKCVGANHNISDVKNVNQVSLIVGNTAGMVVTDSGAGDWTTTEKNQIRHRLGIDGTTSSPSTTPSLAQATVDELGSETYDGRAFSNILPDLLAMAAGRIVEGPVGTYKFYQRDNTTVRYTLTKSGSERVRS